MPLFSDVSRIDLGDVHSFQHFSSGGKSFHLSMSKPGLGSTKPPIQWVPGALSSGLKRPGREAAQLVSKSRKRGSVHPLHGLVLN
jgi:hypothetical protein